MMLGWSRDSASPLSIAESVVDDDRKKESFGFIVATHLKGHENLALDVEKDDGTKLRVNLEARKHDNISAWLTTRGARKLLLPGVQVCIRHEEDDSDNDNQTSSIRATHIIMVGALPVTPYLAKLLSFPIAILQQFFDESPTSLSAIPLGLAVALRPWNTHQCEGVALLCRSSPSDSLFKHPILLQLANDMRASQGWSRTARRACPPTTAATWMALMRMEQQWCRDQDGTVMDHDAVVGDDDDCCGGVVLAVDPLFNLPDPTDARRIKYIDERKRPQVLWMLGRIKKLLLDGSAVDDIKQNRVIQLVDVGGGRGDLAHAVASYFAGGVHVTVLDVNKSSLEAGRARAVALGLSPFLSFVLCDLADGEAVNAIFGNNNSFDLVMGLHCCGGLAEAAVELAIKARAAFCISTCCFRSNLHLASLTRLAESMVVDPLRFEADRHLVSALANEAGSDGQHRAIRVLNAMRLAAAEKGAGMDETHPGTSRLHTWQESFPIKFSVQNRVMIGKVVTA